MSTSENPDLAAINQQVVAPGEQLPQVRLKDGTPVQTGTVAAMLQGVARYNAGERGQAAVPTLIKVGLFELFAPSEWVAGDNPGRRLVGEMAKRLLNKTL